MRTTAAAAAALTMLMVLAGAAQAAPIVSVRVFPTSAPALVDNGSGFYGSFSFGWKVVAEVRGASACDKWRLTGSGSGGTSVDLPGGSRQETGFTGTVSAAPQFARLNASARCTIGTQSIDGTAEEAFVDGPPQPDRAAEAAAPDRFLSQAAEATLRRDAGGLTGTAIVTCRAAALPKRTKGARALRTILDPLCTTSLASAVNAAMPAGGDGGSYSIAQPDPPPAVPASKVKALCKSLRRKQKRQCAGLRKSVAAYLEVARQATGLSGALRETAVAFRTSDGSPSDQLAQAAAGRAYAGRLADAYVLQLAAAKDLVKRLGKAKLALKLSRKEARRAPREFESGKGMPVAARSLLGSGPSAKAVAGLLLQLREAAGGGTLDLRRVLVAPLPVDGLLSASGDVTVPMLLALIDRVVSSGDQGTVGDNGPYEQLQGRLRKLDVLCDPDARAAELQAIAVLAGGLAGPYTDLLKRGGAPVAAAPPRDRPAGCPEAKPPAAGQFLALGGFGAGPGQLDRPTDVTVGPGGVYVADQGNSRVQRFARDGTFLGQWGSRPNGDDLPTDGQFLEPVGVATDSAGNVYVTDFRADRVQKFTADGAFITRWGTTGTGDGQFTRTGGVAVDGSGNVYVIDPGGERVQKFDSNGAFLTKFGTKGTGPGQFEAPRGITVAPNGEVYVAERDNGRVQVYGSGGNFLREWGHRGLEEGAFNGCYDVAVDSSGNVWVADLYGYRIEKFTSSGDYLGLKEQFGPNRESFNPFAVAIDGDNIWIADINGATGDRVLMFGPGG